MEEMQKDGNPTPKIDEEEILDLIIETPSPVATPADAVSFSSTPSFPGEEKDDILDLSEDSLLMDDSENGIIELSEPLETDSDLKAEQNNTLFLEEPLSDEEAENILDLSEEFEVSSASGTSMAISSEPSLASEPTSESLSDMDELLSLLSDDALEPALASPATPESTAGNAKDLVAEGFELGEALDDEILKEMGASTALAGIRASAPEPVDSRFEAMEKVSTAQIEAAIERVIERRLGEKIDKLLTTAIEKAVSREIDRLKRLLSDG